VKAKPMQQDNSKKTHKHLFSKGTWQHEKRHTQASWQLWHVPLSEYLACKVLISWIMLHQSTKGQHKQQFASMLLQGSSLLGKAW